MRRNGIFYSNTAEMSLLKLGVFFTLFLFIAKGYSAMGDNEFPDILIEPFPILSWVPPAIDEQQLGWYKEAGFTVLTIYPDEQTYQTMKKHWDGNYILFKEWSGHTYDQMLAFHPEDKNKIGYLLGDEPLYGQLVKYKEIADKMRNADPHRLCLVNLFPSYVGETRLGNGFLDYLKDSFELIKPRYCVLDHYPLLWFDVQKPSFYYDIEMLRKFAMWNNSKQIGFVQTYSSTACRDVSESDLAWQVNTFLAYGCKGLWYFNFRHPTPGLSGAKEPQISKAGVRDYRTLPGVWTEYYKPVYETFGNSSVLGIDDKPSYVFEYTKKINAQVAAWGPLLLTLENTAVRHVVNRQPFAPVGTEIFDTGKGESWQPEFSSVPLVRVIRAIDPDKDKGYIAGYFKSKDGENYVMIVNKRFGEYISCAGGRNATVIEFDELVKNVLVISNIDGTSSKAQVTNNRLNIDIDGGGAILLKLEVGNSQD